MRDWPGGLAKRRLHEFHGQDGSIWMQRVAANREGSRYRLTVIDAGRLARVVGVLGDAAQRFQMLILTCHPERYRGLAGANFVDLEAIVRGAGCWNLMVPARAESGPNGAPTQTFST